jgi:hypothetical protein
MAKFRLPLTILLFVIMLAVSRESLAVIYRYVNEKGVPTFADDMQKIPEKLRASAVMVSGAVADDAAEAERARLAKETVPRTEQRAAVPVQAEEPLYQRLIRSGIAVGVFIGILFVLKNIHGLHEQAQLLSRIRAVLVLLLFAFLGFTHAKDISGMFGKAGETVKNPIAQMQEDSAAKGKKAAEAYKALDRVLEDRLNERAREEEARLRETEKKFDEAERAR